MKLRGRIAIAFITIITIPIIMIATVGSMIIKNQIISIQRTYNVDSNTIQVITNPMQLLNRVTRGVYNDIKLCALKEPEKLEDMDYIKRLNSELVGKYSFIVLRKGNEIAYAGDQVKFERISVDLPKFADYTISADGGIYLGGEYPCLIKQQDFYYQDGTEGSIFVVTDVNKLIPQLESSIIQCMIAFVLIIFLTAVVLTFWIYRSVLHPLRTLQVATNRIKSGDLDFTVQAEKDDEVGVLCEDFEEMRCRIKELIEVRMQYERDTKELISNISHDLKTPLTAIKGYAEGIMDGVADTPEKQEKYLKTIYTKAVDMTSLVDELSFYSKIDCNTIPYNFAKIYVDQYFTDCIEELGLDLEVKNIDVAYFNYTDDNVRVIADPEQLKRVVNNIIGNSVKYIDKKKGIINVRINDIGEFVRIELEDNGQGIAEEDLSNIFDRFYRTDQSRNSSKGGTGLGLAIAKKVIEDHGGSIWVSSKELVGTTIYFTLKKVEEDKEELNDLPEVGDNSNTKSRRDGDGKYRFFFLPAKDKSNKSEEDKLAQENSVKQKEKTKKSDNKNEIGGVKE
ncbi:sensor histidine kinase [Anaerosporobacter sp.]|uniref:sensor histidine kinase n=1 Tax=Anaerosporobacter sp. TaxID=1872529 RepID=UPI00286F2DD9|nr:HAMP domain-containing sensor histidine kinase [Anaerosporobacter sp.]